MTELDVMKGVLRKEAKAILDLADAISIPHKEVLDICEKCAGKIIITGMGKSGHVARKISATLSSLGTPSFYMHPGEAAHGDLGMIEKKDVVMMISKSGETDELKQLISSIKIIGATTVGIFCKKNSYLENHCDYSLVLPIEEEACNNNLAPTTSTTMTMAFGDALAVALASKKGFGKNDFALFHPKGSLGKQLLLTVMEIANNNMSEIEVKECDTVQTILWNITKNRLGAISIIDEDNRLVGLVSDGDIRRAIEKEKNFLGKKAYEIMTKSPIYVFNDVLAVDAFKLMSDKKISVLPIVDKKMHLKGMVSFHDIVALGLGDNK